ncbi:Adaptive-response sensory-kinase SasA [Allocatenococcus thiocycli]|nr:Adaptive-response sensory-kinase SasA [Catenococcus thiocycli]
MIRAFSILWLVVFIPIILLVLPSSCNPIQHLNESFSERFYKEVYANNFDILTNRLLKEPQSQWPVTIQAYAKFFAYPLKLESIEKYRHEGNLSETIMQGDITFLFGDPMALVKRVGNSDYLIYFALNESTKLAVLNQTSGLLHLISEQLHTLPKSEWSKHLALKNELSPFQIGLKGKSDLLPYEIEAINDSTDSIVSYLSPEGHVELLAYLEEGSWIHVQDNLSQSAHIKLTSAMGVIFFILISGALVIWVFPLWKDLKCLVLTANDFGQGVLSRRAKECRLSVVCQLSESFNKMADNIESLIATQRELTNAIAHDLRTPLYRLRFALEMLESNELSETQKAKYHNTIDSSIEDLEHLINQNLLLARYNRIADFTQFSQCYLAEVLAKEIEFFRLENPDLEVRFYCSPNLRSQSLFIDKAGLMRAIKNLLSNASRFTYSKIAVSFSVEGSVYSISVEDDGAGIPSHQTEKVFEPFAQLNNHERSSAKGHGLGLAIVQQVMKWHQGNVLLSQSQLGGALFELTWPALNSPDKNM